METITGNSYERLLRAMSITRKDCSCGGKTILDVYPKGPAKKHEYYVKCISNTCTRESEILFEDPVDAVNYWNNVGWHVDPYDI